MSLRQPGGSIYYGTAGPNNSYSEFLVDNFGFARDPGRNRDGVREIRLGLLEISGDFLKSVEWAAFHPSYNRARKRAQNVPKEKR